MSEPLAGWITIDEAAALIRVPKSWLYERTRLNTVPHVKLGKYLRFDREELLTWARQFHRDGRGQGPLTMPIPTVTRSPKNRRAPSST
jgi:excisionase family DNA binding protein